MPAAEKPMRVLLVTPYFFEPYRWMISGYKAALGLSALGHDIVVFTSGSRGQAEVEEASPHLKVYRFRDFFLPDPVNFGIMPFLFWRIVRVLRRERPTHFLVCKYMFHTSLAAPLLKLLGKKVVVMTDSFPGISWFSRSRFVNAVMWVYARTLGMIVLKTADRVLLLHEGLVPTAERFRIRHARVHHNGVDRKLFRDPPSLRDVIRGEDEVVITYVGRLESVKGYDLLLRIATPVLKRHEKARFLFVGDTTGRSELVACHQGPRLQFLGHRNDVPSILAASDVFVLASYSEGLPNALMEAMAAGCACVATSVGGVPWLMEGGAAGLIVPPGDPEALQQAIERLLGDPKLRVRLGARAREVIAEQYDLDRLSRELAEILQSV
jgi:glycosyltransferase involved in cell wall biosynthesis